MFNAKLNNSDRIINSGLAEIWKEQNYNVEGDEYSTLYTR